MAPLDRFSAQAVRYARYRIEYPQELYTELLADIGPRRRAWDCAFGNGQVAAVLARYFVHVDATDSSAAQLAEAAARPNKSFQHAVSTKREWNLYGFCILAKRIYRACLEFH